MVVSTLSLYFNKPWQPLAPPAPYNEEIDRQNLKKLLNFIFGCEVGLAAASFESYSLVVLGPTPGWLLCCRAQAQKLCTRFSCSMSWGSFQTRDETCGLLGWQVDTLALIHQGRSHTCFLKVIVSEINLPPTPCSLKALWETKHLFENRKQIWETTGWYLRKRTHCQELRQTNQAYFPGQVTFL